MRLENYVCQDLPGPNASQTTVLASALPGLLLKLKNIFSQQREADVVTPSSQQQAELLGKGAGPGLRILCMNALSKSFSKWGSHCSSETNKEGGESDSPVRWAYSLQEGISHEGPLLHAGLRRCHHLSSRK